MAKHIPYREIIYRFDKHELKVPARDDDANMIIKNPDAEPDEREVEFEVSDTIKLMRHILYSVPRSVQAQSDGIHAPAVHNDILNAEALLKKAKTPAAKSKLRIVMREADYDWLHRMLNREVPATKEDKEQGVTEKQSVARRLFTSFSAAVVVNQIKDIDEFPLDKDIFETETDQEPEEAEEADSSTTE